MRFTPKLRFFRRESTARVQPDPADLGTCFGMEASLENVGADYCDRPTYPLESKARQVVAECSPLAWLSQR